MKKVGFVVLCVALSFPYMFLVYLLDLWVLKGDWSQFILFAIAAYPASLILFGILRMAGRYRKGEKVIVNYLAFYTAAFLPYIVAVWAFVHYVFGAGQANVFNGLMIMSYFVLVVLIQTVRQSKRYRRGEAVKVNFIYTLLLGISLGGTMQNNAQSFGATYQQAVAVGTALDADMAARTDGNNADRRIAYVFNILINAVTILSMLAFGLYRILPGRPGLYFSGIAFAYGALLVSYELTVILFPALKASVSSVKGMKKAILNDKDARRRKRGLIGYYLGNGVFLAGVAFIVMFIIFLVLAMI